MFEKLEAVEKRYEELTKMISDPEIISNQTEWQKAMKEHASIEDIVLKFREYKKAKEAMEEAKEMMEDKELRELAEIEFYDNKEKLPKLEEELKFLLIPKDPDDDKNIICEIRAGAGGEEAALFAGTLFRMYTMYAETKHWKLEVLNENETELGGYKETESEGNIIRETKASISISPFRDIEMLVYWDNIVYHDGIESVKKTITEEHLKIYDNNIKNMLLKSTTEENFLDDKNIITTCKTSGM